MNRLQNRRSIVRHLNFLQIALRLKNLKKRGKKSMKKTRFFFTGKTPFSVYLVHSFRSQSRFDQITNCDASNKVALQKKRRKKKKKIFFETITAENDEILDVFSLKKMRQNDSEQTLSSHKQKEAGKKKKSFFLFCGFFFVPTEHFLLCVLRIRQRTNRLCSFAKKHLFSAQKIFDFVFRF